MMNRETLKNEFTVVELREMCRDMGIARMGKARKDVIISAILEAQVELEASREVAIEEEVAPVSHMEAVENSIPTNPDVVDNGQFVVTSAKTESGDQMTAISVSCGASTGKFNVVGKSVAAVAEFLKEVLNISELAEPVVDGVKVSYEYKLTSTDTLEFIKPAGDKGADMMNREVLNGYTVVELREMARDMEIPRMGKARKDVIIAAIIEAQVDSVSSENEESNEAVAISHLERVENSVLTDPDVVDNGQFVVTSAKNVDGDQFTAITVSCGASTGKFNVVGKSVAAVAEFLKEVLNISELAEPVVDGVKVSYEYKLTSTDTLEFIKPAGDKG